MSEKRQLENEDALLQKPAKRLRQISDDRREFAKIFDELASDAESVRLQAALDLVQRCKNNNGVGKEPMFESARPICVRLIRGLCSNRKSARHGFFVALVEVFRLFKSSPELREECLKLIVDNSKPEEGGKGQERRNALLGRMSAYTAVIHSKLFFHGSQSQIDRFKAVLNAIFDDHDDLPWLHEQVGSIVDQTLSVLKDDQAPSEWFAAIIDVLVQHNRIKTPLGIAIWLKLVWTAPSTKLPKHIWYKQDPLCSKALQDTIQIMKRSGRAGTDEQQPDRRKNTTGARQTIPSFVWDVIITFFLRNYAVPGPHDHSAQVSRQFSDFWTGAVDDNFFAQSSSHEKRHTGFQILLSQLSKRPSWMLEIMLSPNLVNCLINQSAQPGRYLNTMAKIVLDGLIDKTRHSSDVCMLMLKRLLCSSDTTNFDERTKSITAKVIFDVAINAPHLLPDILKILAEPFDRSAGLSEKDSQLQCQIIANLLTNYAREHANYTHEDCAQIVTIMEFLAARAYCQKEQSDQKDLENRKRAPRMAFETGMAALAAKKNRSVITEVASRITLQLIKAGPSPQGGTHQSLDWLRQYFKRSQALTLCDLLCCLAVLRFAENDDDALSIFQDVKNIHSHSQDDLTENDSDVVTDILLQFIADTSVMHRRIAMWAFELTSSRIGVNGLQTLFDVLDKPENVSGKNDLEQEPADDTGSDGESSQGGGDDTTMQSARIELGSDVEEVSEDDASSASSSANNSDSDASELTRFNSALASTLGTAVASDAISDDSSDTSMDSEQMHAIEPQLAEMFRQRLGEGASHAKKSAKPGGEKKQEQAAARRDILDFKNRVLDMLELWLKDNPANQLALEAVPPLLRLVRTTRSKQLREKAAEILRAWQIKAKKKGEPPFVAEADGEDGGRTSWEILAAIHQEALAKPFLHLHVNLCSSTSLFVCRCAVRSARDKDGAEKVVTKRVKRVEKQYARTGENAGERLKETAFWRDFEGWKRDVLANVERKGKT